MGYTLRNIKYCPFKDLDYSYISSDFGKRTFYNNKTKKTESDFHNGLDMTSGKIVVATFNGIVKSVQNEIKGYDEKNSSGNYVTIDHGNNIITSYCHMKYHSIKVKSGDYVVKGQELGEKGATGHATGAHLHYGIKINGSWLDPVDYLLGNKIIDNNTDNKDNSFEYINYVIKKNDTLTKIAKLYNTSVQELVKINNIQNPNLIITGHILKIPIYTENRIVYIVKRGDTLSGIAKKYNTTWQKIFENNKEIIGNNPNLIKIGQKLLI